MKTPSFNVSNFYGRLWIVITIFTVLFIGTKPIMKAMFPIRYAEEIQQYSTYYNVDEHLIMAVISAESKFNKYAVSCKGAKGLMQIRDKTALWCMEKFGIDGDIEDIHNPELNINIGCAYMAYLLDKFVGDTATAVAAYNAGEGNVKKWLGGKASITNDDILFKETENYVKKVSERKNIYKFLY